VMAKEREHESVSEGNTPLHILFCCFVLNNLVFSSQGLRELNPKVRAQGCALKKKKLINFCALIPYGV